MTNPGLKEGVRVRIKKDISETDKRFQTTSEMRKMRGKVYRLSSISGDSVLVNGWTWHADDVEIVVKDKDPQPFHFNIEVMET